MSPFFDLILVIVPHCEKGTQDCAQKNQVETLNPKQRASESVRHLCMLLGGGVSQRV